MSKQNTAERLDRLEAMLGKLLERLEEPAAPEPPPTRVVPTYSAGGPPSAFMSFVAAQRGLRAEPVADDPEAAALEDIADKLASMHPIDKQAYLDKIRHKGKRDDLRKQREALGYDPLTDEELDEMLGGAD